MIDIARQDKIELPAYTVEGLTDLVFKPKYSNLEEYLAGFAYTTAVMRNPDALEQISYEFAVDNFNENVRYDQIILFIFFFPCNYIIST